VNSQKTIILANSIGFKRKEQDGNHAVSISVRPCVTEVLISSDELTDLYVWLGQTIPWLRQANSSKTRGAT
jgi:hypothetical protein